MHAVRSKRNGNLSSYLSYVRRSVHNSKTLKDIFCVLFMQGVQVAVGLEVRTGAQVSDAMTVAMCTSLGCVTLPVRTTEYTYWMTNTPVVSFSQYFVE